VFSPVFAMLGYLCCVSDKGDDGVNPDEADGAAPAPVAAPPIAAGGVDQEQEAAAQKIQAVQRGKQGRKRAKERQDEIDKYRSAASAAPAEDLGGEEGGNQGPTRLLSIDVVSAKNLRNVVSGLLGKKSSPFVRLEVGGVTVETSIMRSALNPVWNEPFEVADYKAGTDVNFSVWHPAVKKKGEICLGRASLPATAFETEAYDSALKLNDTGLKKGDAFLNVKVAWFEKKSEPNGKRISAFRVDAPVEMWITRFRAIGLRFGPGLNESRTGVDLKPGEEFGVVETVEGGGGQKYLRLQDGRGWAFMVSAKDGEILAEKLDAKEVEVIEEEGVEEEVADKVADAK